MSGDIPAPQDPGPHGSGPGDLEADRIRLSDAERQQVVDALRRHTADGRLGMDEFEERSATALAARTRRDLRGVLGDLPSAAGLDGPATVWAGAVPAPVPATPPGPTRPLSPAPTGACGLVGGGSQRGSWGWQWRAFWFTTALMIAIWVLSGTGYFWPAWVILPYGLSLVLRVGHRRDRRAGPLPPARS